MISLYKKTVVRMLDQLDSKRVGVFNAVICFVMKALAVVMLVVSLYLVFSGLFGKTGYFATLRGVGGFELARTIVCFIVTFAINIAAFVLMSAIIWRRADGFLRSDDKNILNIFPRLVRTVGEVACVVPIFVVLVSFMAMLFAAIPYAPIDALTSFSGGYVPPFLSDMVGNTFSAIFLQNFKDYIALLFNGGVMGLLQGFGFSFLILLGTYLVAELFELLVAFLARR